MCRLLALGQTIRAFRTRLCLLDQPQLLSPKDKRAIADVRKNLIKMTRDYVLEFVWLMKTYGAARRQDVQELLRTPSMKRVLGPEREQADRLLDDIPEEPQEL